MLPNAAYPPSLIDSDVSEVSAGDVEPLPLGIAFPLMFALSLALWVMIAAAARMLI